MTETALPAMPLAPDSFWSRLCTTPIREALRGQLTGSLDVRRVIAAADLPDPLPSLTYQTVCRTKLRRSMRLEAARELISRFRGDLIAGRAPDDIVVSFGDPLDVARTIRHEKRLALTWRRLAKTPLRDVLRGRLTGSLDLHRAIAGAALPPSLSDVILLVVRRTRLWRAERVDVARELAEHFRDGLSAGGTPQQLILSFGDLRQAARLIRRAKIRRRPLPWRVFRRAQQAVGLLIVCAVMGYAFCWLRFISAKPTIAHNYGLDLTAPARAVPEADRAWPLYRKALLGMTPEPRILKAADATWSDDEVTFSAATEVPSGKHWHMVVAWLDENRQALDVIRQAATRPRLGFIYGDPADRAWVEKSHSDPKLFDLSRNPPLYHLSLNELQDFRNIMTLLEADVHRAASQDDAETFVRDVEAAVGIANQIRDGLPSLVTDLVSFSLFLRALTLVDLTLAERPELLSEDNLKRLAHCIGGYSGGGPLHCGLSGQRVAANDLYQRIYTDDGHGDGRLTPEGFRILNSLRILDRGNADWAVAPVLSALIASRREMAAATEQFFDRLESAISQPYWQSMNSDVDVDIRRWSKSSIDKVRYAPVIAESFLVDAAFYGERVTQQRDASLVALALELYRRRHGDWPKRLDDLVPDLLPAVPPDRFTGSPILYRIIDGHPVVYSAGPDQKDDGGRSVDKPDEIQFRPVRRGTSEKVPQGDWILWPPQKANSGR